MGHVLTMLPALLVLAQQAAETERELPPEARTRAFAIVLLTAILGILGIIIILLLGVTWRRYNARVRSEARLADLLALDPWTTAAERTRPDDHAPDTPDTPDAPDDEGNPPAGNNPPRGPRPRPGSKDDDGNPPVPV